MIPDCRGILVLWNFFILSNENKIKGTYFNNPVQKNTYGEIDVKFVSRKRLKIFKPNA